MKAFLFFFLVSSSVFAAPNFPLQIGIGFESCRPNADGLTECVGLSPQFKKEIIELDIAPESETYYGLFTQRGQFEDIGFEVSVKVTSFDRLDIDDMLTLKVKTWKLNNPNESGEVISEVFTRGPEKLNRVNQAGPVFGSEDNFAKIILGIRAY